jgi:AcrR family transcriptional regulator
MTDKSFMTIQSSNLRKKPTLREKAKASKREAILAAAGRQFARRDYDQVLLDEIAAQAQVAKGTLYLYFASKADLYLALIMESLAPLIQRLHDEVPVAAEKSAWAGIRLIVGEMLAFNVEHPGLQEALRESSRASLEAMCGDMKRSLITLVESTLRKGVERGELVDPAPEATAYMILGSASRASMWMAEQASPRGSKLAKGRGNRWSTAAVADHLLRIFGDGLLAGRK